MEGLMLMLLFPLAFPFVAKLIWKKTLNWQETGLNIAVVSVVTIIVWQLGTFSATWDTEIWNGTLLSKERVQGTYEQAYDCNCTTDSDGNRSCMTCYETHYTVDWSADTNIGGINFQHLDRTSRSVYSEPDPVAYVNAKVGDPVALAKRYTNYVKAVPESLFHDDSTVAQQYAGKIPAYPSVYDFYRINRVLIVDAKVSSKVHDTLNNGLAQMLKVLGPAKQANINMIITGLNDPSYRYAIENAWLGGKKNDITIFIGVDGNKIVWTDAMTWAMNSGNELFQVTMRDDLQKVGELDPEKILPVVQKTVAKLFDRPHMKDYEYLKDAIQPPMWLIILGIFISFGGSIGLTIYFHKNDIDFLEGTRFGRNRGYRYRR